MRFLTQDVKFPDFFIFLVPANHPLGIQQLWKQKFAISNSELQCPFSFLCSSPASEWSLGVKNNEELAVLKSRENKSKW